MQKPTQFLAHRFYSHLSTKESRYYAIRIEKNTHPVYGEGFKHMRALIEKVGLQHLVETICTNKKLPIE